MNVRELIDALEDYGDHLKVTLVLEQEADEHLVTEFDVDDVVHEGERAVALRAEID